MDGETFARQNRATVLIVEDDPALAELLTRHIMSLGHFCIQAPDAASARAAIGRSRFDLVLLDIRLPDGSGVELLDLIRARLPDSAVVMTTAVQDVPTAIECFKKGAYAYLVKPFSLYEVTIEVENALHRRSLEMNNRAFRHRLERMVKERTRELEKTLARVERNYDQIIRALSKSTEVRCPEGSGHLGRVAKATLILGRSFGFSGGMLKELERGALLHDVGMIAIPDAILFKKGPLNQEEWRWIRKHPEIGYEIVSKVNYLRGAAKLVRAHHERFDGNGYPNGLRGEEIPLSARIFTLADVLDAIVTGRPYRPPVTFEEASEQIISLSGSHFDPRVVEEFTKLKDEIGSEVYPEGDTGKPF